MLRGTNIFGFLSPACPVYSSVFRTLKLVLFILLSCLSPAFATQAVVAPRVKVLFDEPALWNYAERVAVEAEGALDTLIPLFGFEPPPITLRVENTTDLYNATASPLPRPNVGVRALFPTEISLGYGARDELRLLLIHELTHIMQLTNLAGRGDGLRLGLAGERVANVPPAWLVEGLAVWTESEFTAGGRRDDALTQGVLGSVALSGTWPSLSDASLSTYGTWPGPQTEYLFGGAFTGYLVRKHGVGAIKKVLEQHNSAGLLRPFADSWRVAVGTDLEREWQAWEGEIRAQAERLRRKLEPKRAGILKTSSGGFTRAPALSPDGRRLAWVASPGEIRLADVRGGTLREERVLLDDRLPGGLEWLDSATLLYARPVLRPGTTYGEVFTLDTHTGRETQLTVGARAKLAAPLPNRCVLYLTDDGTRSSLLERCPDGQTRTRYESAPDVHLVGLATSRAGRIAVSRWRQGAIELAVLEGDRLRTVTNDWAQALEPTWRGENTLLFRSDRAGGPFELYELELDSSPPKRLSATVGGAFMPEAGAGGVWFTPLRGGGYDLAWLPAREPLPTSTQVAEEPERLMTRPPTAFSVRPYRPLDSLVPYGWLPSGVGASLAPLGVSAEASLIAQDDSTDHNLRGTVGFDSQRAALAGFYAFARYDYGGGGLPLRATLRPLRYGLQAGAWPIEPHLTAAQETALGVKANVTARSPADRVLVGLGLEAGLVHLLGDDVGLRLDARADASVSTNRLDVWGYRIGGWRVAATGVWSATRDEPSLGAWVDGSYLLPVEPFGRLEFGVRAGYRPAWPFPLEVEGDLAVLASVGGARSFPVGWRFGDGLYALERVTLEPRLRGWVDNAFHVGGDLTASLDTVLSYNAPASLSGTLGYAGGFWTRVGLRLPL